MMTTKGLVTIGLDMGTGGALLVIRLVAESGASLSERIAPIGWPAITPDLRIPVRGDVRAVLDTISSRCGGQITRIDGVRAQYDDGWALARASITEPVITLRFETKNSGNLREMARRFLVAVPELSGKVMEMIDERCA